MQELASVLGMSGLYVLLGLVCLVGIGLSCVGISGTWLVLAAAVVAALVRGDAFPGGWTIVLFAVACGTVELAEALAGAWGVRRRGGSRRAGVLAVIGGLLGLGLGTLFPVPVLGSLLGMLLGSFVLVFAVERRRLASNQKAAGIAWGAVTARILVLFLKVVVTLGMTIVLFGGMLVRP